MVRETSRIKQLNHKVLRSLQNLTKKRKQLLFCLLILCVFCLFGFLNAYAVNNSVSYTHLRA
ncbi:hypothetical protein KQJ29_38410, partial [Enterococcus sp. S181_ASV_20]|nr:hypothetical protein [Enterococcus sp. S181_ASV_20]